MCSLSNVTKQNYFLKTTVMQMKYLDTVCEGEPHCNITVIVGIPSPLLLGAADGKSTFNPVEGDRYIDMSWGVERL